MLIILGMRLPQLSGIKIMWGYTKNNHQEHFGPVVKILVRMLRPVLERLSPLWLWLHPPEDIDPAKQQWWLTQVGERSCVPGWLHPCLSPDPCWHWGRGLADGALFLCLYFLIKKMLISIIKHRNLNTKGMFKKLSKHPCSTEEY